MSKTIVIQSYRLPISENWLQTCINTVKAWAELNQYQYKFIDDKLFSYVPVEILEKTKSQPIIATDLARLKVLQEFLRKGYERVIWCDADFIIFAPEQFSLPDETYALGREVWIQQDSKITNKLVANIKVHNAFMLFRKENTFLDFYAEVAERLVMNNKGSMPPQFIGPKLLTAIHNVVQCPVFESAGMLSPLVAKDIVKGKGHALDLFKTKSSHEIYGANMCNSLFGREGYSAKIIEDCLTALLRQQAI